ncbi:15267_t:CDS:1, partial [Cetraspora pellucida]
MQQISTTPLNVQDFTDHEPWQISDKLEELIKEFQEKILYDHPPIPCAYCSILMMNQTTYWIDYNDSENYTLPIAFPNTRIITHVNNRGKKK